MGEVVNMWPNYSFGLKREARERFDNFLTNHFGPAKP